MTTPKPYRPGVMRLKSHGQFSDARPGPGRARREKYKLQSDRLVSKRLKQLEKRWRFLTEKPEPCCRERYLAWLRSGHDARYYPLSTFGPAGA